MTDQELQDRLDAAIMRAKPENLSDEELDRRLELSNKSSRLSEIESDNTWDVSPRGLLAGGLKSLPMVGAIGGGFIGGPTPLGLAGAGLGAAGGKALQNIGEKYLLDEDKTREEIYLDPVKEGVQGAALEGAGQILGKALQGGAGMLRGAAKIKPNSEQIYEATRALGAEPTTGQLVDSKMLQGLESSLEQSPSIGGILTRRQTEPVRRAMREGAEGVFNEVPSVTASEVGAKFKTDLRNLVEERLAPISKIYDDVRGSTEFIDVNPRSLKRVANNIRAGEKFKSSSGYSIAQQTADDLEKVATVDDLKDLRSSVGKRMSSPLLDNEARSTLNAIYGKLSSLEQNSMMREAIRQGRNSKEGLDLGKKLVSDLKGANTGYRGVMQDLGLLGKGSGVSKRVSSIENFLTKIDEIPDEKIVDTFFKTNNRKYLKELQRVNPEGFENLRVAKLDQLRKASEVNGEISPAKLLRNFKNMEPETRRLVAGDDSAEILKNLEIVVNSWPLRMGPSGTPQGLEFMNVGNILNPAFWGREVGRSAQRGLLSGARNFENSARSIKNPAVQRTTRELPKGLLMRDE